MKTFILAGVALAALVAVPTVAQNAKPGPGAPVTRSEVESRVRTMFDRLDTNKDGFVAQDEAKAVREGARSAMRERVFARLDADKNGSISRAEFDAPRAKSGERAERGGKRDHHRGMAMRGLGGGKMFARADADKDGRVSLAEATLMPLQRFDRADANKDGTLTPEERKAARETMRGHRQQRRG